MCKYHSSVTLTSLGNFLVAGSKPNDNFNSAVDKFASELRVVTLDPPCMFVERPKILDTPAKLVFNRRITVPSPSPPRSVHGTSSSKVPSVRRAYST